MFTPKEVSLVELARKALKKKEILWKLNVNINVSRHQVDLLDLIHMLVNLVTNVDMAPVEDLDRADVDANFTVKRS